jgi:uncharacterized OB-fold protein
MAKPVPRPTAETREFWAGCNEERLLFQSCRACAHVQFYPRRICTACAGAELVCRESAGLGSIHSFTVVHHPAVESFRADAPFVIALVDFDEGFRVMLNVVGANALGARIGARVRTSFEQRSPEQKIPQAELLAPS